MSELPPFIDPQSGRPVGRFNGLRAESYVRLATIDPRVTDELLRALADEGIAGYAAPSGGQRTAFLGTSLPSRPAHELYVDPVHRDRARAVLDAAAETLAPEPEPVDPDAAFESIVAGLKDEFEPPTWPDTSPEVVDAKPPWGAPLGWRSRPVGADEIPGLWDDPLPEEEVEHYSPPPPPALAPAHPITRWAVLAIAVGMALLMGPWLLGMEEDDSVAALGVLTIVGGIGVLVARMRDAGPHDGPDDGAVV